MRTTEMRARMSDPKAIEPRLHRARVHRRPKPTSTPTYIGSAARAARARVDAPQASSYRAMSPRWVTALCGSRSRVSSTKTARPSRPGSKIAGRARRKTHAPLRTAGMQPMESRSYLSDARAHRPTDGSAALRRRPLPDAPRIRARPLTVVHLLTVARLPTVVRLTAAARLLRVRRGL